MPFELYPELKHPAPASSQIGALSSCDTGGSRERSAAFQVVSTAPSCPEKQAGGNVQREAAAGVSSAVLESASNGAGGFLAPFFAPSGRGALGGAVAFADLGSATRLLYRTTQHIKLENPAKKPKYHCERSRYCLAGPGEIPGSTRLLLAPCKSNDCPYCGRVKMYRKRNRIYDRLAEDAASGRASAISYEFVTTTLRPGALTLEQAFKWLKPAMAYAIQKVRRARVYNKRYRRAAWDGCELAYINDVDIQPGTKMPHTHALYSVVFPGAAKKKGARGRLARRMVKELHYYLNCFLRSRLGLPKLLWREDEPYPFQGENSLAYVHLSGSREDGTRGDEADGARSAQNVAMYMALHNGKIWTDGREYPKRYRRFATSKGYFPAAAEKAASAWKFVRQSLAGVSAKLAAQNVPVGPPALGDIGAAGEPLSVLALGDVNSYRVRWALGLAEGAEDLPEVKSREPLPLETLAKMQALEAYWDSGADLDGGRVETVVNTLRPGLYGPPGVHSRFVPGVSFEEWQAGAAARSLSDQAEEHFQHPAPASARISASEGCQAGEMALAADLEQQAGELLALCPTMSPEQARAWVLDVQRIRRRQASGAGRPGCPRSSTRKTQASMDDEARSGGV